MIHTEYIIPTTVAVGGFLFSAWLTFFPKKALAFYVDKMQSWPHLVIFPPKKNRFYFWHTLIFGIVGCLFFGLGFVGMLHSLLYD